MKTLKFFAALTICAMLVSSCKDDSMVSALDAEQVIARTSGNSGMYSDYILSESEAIAMVANDLKQSGGEFAKKHISHVEPVIQEYLMELYDPEMVEEDLMRATDPAFYLMHFNGGGFAVFYPDKRLGVAILHAQTAGSVTAEDFYNGIDNLGNNGGSSSFNDPSYSMGVTFPPRPYYGDDVFKMIEFLTALNNWIKNMVNSIWHSDRTLFKHDPKWRRTNNLFSLDRMVCE